MQFSDPTDKQGLVQDIDFHCDTNSVSYPIEDKTRNINRWYYVVLSDILKVDGRFQFDDKNHNDLPHFTTDLVDGQKAYKLPDENIRLRGVEIKGTDGEYRRADQIDINDLDYSITNYRDEPGFPDEYDIMAETIHLFPAPSTDSVTLSEGLKLYITRKLDVFSKTDTTKEPGFDETYHRILSLGASVDWLSTYGTEEDKNDKEAWLQALRADLKEAYASRNPEAGTRLRPSQTNSHQYA